MDELTMVYVVNVVECLPLAERCSDGASEHYYPLPTAVCLENLYLWFDPVKLAKVLTGFPDLEELFPACCQWLSCNAFTLEHF